MPKVKFTETVIYATEGYNKGPTFEAGETYELSDDQAKRWVRRKVAEVVDGKNEKKAKAEESEIADESEDEEEEQEEEEAEGDAQPTMPRRRGRPPKGR